MTSRQSDHTPPPYKLAPQTLPPSLLLAAPRRLYCECGKRGPGFRWMSIFAWSRSPRSACPRPPAGGGEGGVPRWKQRQTQRAMMYAMSNEQQGGGYPRRRLNAVQDERYEPSSGAEWKGKAWGLASSKVSGRERAPSWQQLSSTLKSEPSVRSCRRTIPEATIF